MNPNVTTEASAPKGKKPHAKRTYTFKQKLLPSVLLSLVIPLTVCIFGPFDIYLGNMSVFRYSLTDFFPLCVAGAIFFAGLFFGLLMLLRGKAYEIACAIFLSSSLLMVAQRAFMNMGVTALVDGGGSGADIVLLILNTLIWIAVIGGTVTAVVLLRAKHSEIIETVTLIAVITVIGMQAMSMIIYSVSSDVWMPIDERKEISNEDIGATTVLNFDGFTEFSSGKNVVVFIVDRFDSSFYDKFMKDENNKDFFKDELTGFTYFSDYTTLHSRTYPAVATLLTGVENDFTLTRNDYFEKAYTDGGYIKKLSEEGYDINLYTKEDYAYENASVMEDYVDNIAGVTGYYIDEYFLLAADMVRLAFSDYLPFAAKWTMGYMTTAEFNSHAKYILEDSVAYDSDLKTIKDYMEATEFKVVESKGKFTFIHLDGCHTPFAYGDDWIDTTDEAVQLNFEIIFAYIQQMKELGVYDDATIVITGDHAAPIDDKRLIGGKDIWDVFEEPDENETNVGGEAAEEDEAEGDGNPEDENEADRGIRITAMFFKPAGEGDADANGDKNIMKESEAPISQDELWNTVFESEGLFGLKGDGLSFFDIAKGNYAGRTRRYVLQIDANKVVNRLDEDHIVIYEITGSGLDPNNWECVEKIPIGDLYK